MANYLDSESFENENPQEVVPQEAVPQEAVPQEAVPQEPLEVEKQGEEPQTFTNLLGETRVIPSEYRLSPSSTRAPLSEDAPHEKYVSDVGGFGSWVSHAFAQDSMVHELGKWMGSTDIPEDSSFRWDAQSWDKVTQDIPDDFHHELRAANSLEEATSLRKEVQRRLHIEESLSQYGFAGTVGRFGLAITDPIFLAAMVASEGAASATLGKALLRTDLAGSIAKWGHRGGQARAATYEIGRHLSASAARVGTGIGGVTAIQAGYSPMVDLDDVPTAMFHGAQLGLAFGGVGALWKTGLRRHAVPKEPWNMSPKQFNERFNESGKTHREAVAEHLEGGGEVEGHVLFEYPDLAKEHLTPAHYDNFLFLRAIEEKGVGELSKPQGWVEFWASQGDGRVKPLSLLQEYDLFNKQRSAKREFKLAEKEYEDATNAFLDKVDSPIDNANVREKLNTLLDAEGKLTEAGTDLQFERRELAPHLERLQKAASKYKKSVQKTVETGEQGVSFIDGKEWTASAGELRDAIKAIDAIFTDWQLHNIPKARLKLRELRQLRAKHRKALGKELPDALREIEIWLTDRIKRRTEALKPMEARVSEARAQLDKATGEYTSSLEVGKMNHLKEIRHARKRAKEAEARHEKAELELSRVSTLKARRRRRKLLSDRKGRALFEVKAGRPISEMDARMFPELKEHGAQTFREREIAQQQVIEVKDAQPSVHPEVKSEINSTIPEESLVPLESIEVSANPELIATRDALLGMEEVALERADIELVLEANNIPYASTDTLPILEAKYNNLQREALFKDRARMKKFVSHIKDNGFVTEVKPTAGVAELERALLNFEREVHGEPPLSKKAYEAQKKVEKASVKMREAQEKFRKAERKAKQVEDSIPLEVGKTRMNAAKRQLKKAEDAVNEAVAVRDALIEKGPKQTRKGAEPVLESVPDVKPRSVGETSGHTPLTAEEINAKVDARKDKQKEVNIDKLNANLTEAKGDLREARVDLKEAEADVAILDADSNIPKLNDTQKKVVKALDEWYSGLEGPWQEIQNLSRSDAKAMAEEMGLSVTGGDVLQGYHGIKINEAQLTAKDYVAHIKERYGEIIDAGEPITKSTMSAAHKQVTRAELKLRDATRKERTARQSLKEGEALESRQATDLEHFRKELEAGNVDPNVRAQEKLTKAVVTAEKRLAEARVREAEATQQAYDAAKKENPLYTEWEKTRNTRRSKVSKLKEDVKALKAELKELKDSLRETKAKEKLRKEEANTAPTYRTPTEELLRFGFDIGPRTLNPTSIKLVKSHLADGRFSKSVTAAQLKPFLLDSGYSAIPRGWMARDIRVAANVRIKEYSQFQYIKYKKGRKAEIEAFTERVETLDSKISTAQKNIKEQQAEVKDQVDLLAVLQSKKPRKKIMDAVEIPPTKLPQLRQAVKEAKQAIKEHEKSIKDRERVTAQSNKKAIREAKKEAEAEHKKLVGEARERYRAEVKAYNIRLKSRKDLRKAEHREILGEVREGVRSTKSVLASAKKESTAAKREFNTGNKQRLSALEKYEKEKGKLDTEASKVKEAEDAWEKMEGELEAQEGADLIALKEAQHARRLEREKIEKDIKEHEGETETQPVSPEPEEASHAVVMERFNRTATIGMPKWRSLFGNKLHTSFSAEVGHVDTFGPMRWIGDQILQESIAKIDPLTGMKVPSRMTAHSRADMRTYRAYLELGENYRNAYDSWLVEEGMSNRKRITNEADDAFGNAVSKVVRGIEETANPHISKAAEAVRNALKKLDKTMETEGIIEKAFEDPNYLPRKILTSELTKGINTHGMIGLTKFFREAIMEGHNKVNKGDKVLLLEEANFMAEAYLRNIHERHFRVDYTNNGFLGERSGETLRKYLEIVDTPEAAIKAILNKTRLGERDASPKYLKHRMLMDEGFTAEVIGKDGQSRTVQVTDFFDNNAKRLMDGHIRQVYGAIEARKIGLKFNEILGKSSKDHPNPATFGEMWEWIQRAGERDGVDNMIVLKDQFDRMEALVKGYSHEKPSALGTNIRMAQKYAGATYGGSFGTAAIAEVGQPLAHSSWSAYMAHIGELPKMIKALKSGTVDNQLLREIAYATGVGTEGKAYREVSTMLEHHGRGLDEGMSRAEAVLSNLQQGAFKYGLLTSIDAIQRQYAAMLFSQELLNGALKGRIPYSETRLFQIGLDKETASSIMRSLREHASYEKTGRNKLIAFNFDKWVSAEALEAKASLSEAIFLHTRKVIHQTHAGQLPRIMQNPVGRMLFQFRNFTIGSYETQLLSNLQAMDKRSMASFSINTFFGGLSYMAIVGLKYGHDVEKMKKYLELNELAKGAFYRSGYATHAPMLMDTILHTFGGEPWFTAGRPSGLSTSLLDFSSSPVGSLVDGVFGVGKGMIAPSLSEEYDFSQQDYRKARKLTFYQNMGGLSFLHGKLSQAFPEKSKGN